MLPSSVLKDVEGGEPIVMRLERYCRLCYGVGHGLEGCPRLGSINKIRDNLGYEPIKVVEGKLVREDWKTTKSLETRVDAVEKDVQGLKSSFGQLKFKVDALAMSSKKPGTKRKCEEKEEAPAPQKKSKKDTATVEKAAGEAAGPSKSKKKRAKRGKKGSADGGGVGKAKAGTK